MRAVRVEPPPASECRPGQMRWLAYPRYHNEAPLDATRIAEEP